MTPDRALAITLAALACQPGRCASVQLPARIFDTPVSTGRACDCGLVSVRATVTQALRQPVLSEDQWGLLAQWIESLAHGYGHDQAFAITAAIKATRKAVE